MTAEATIELADGRTLSYRCLGDPEGVPLFYFHGTPASRLEIREQDRLAQIDGLRLICPERPGYGLSTFQPNRTLLDWPSDVAALADHLELGPFAVGGLSGGGPHALVCGHALADRVTAVLLFASSAPTDFEGATTGMSFGNRLGLLLQRWLPPLYRGVIRSNVRMFEKDPERFLEAFVKQLPAPDQALVEDGATRQHFLRDLQEAYRQGSQGHELDGALVLTSRHWGFELSQVEAPVYLWYGLADTLVTENMARYLEAELPSCRARYLEGIGHLVTDEPAVVNDVAELLSSGALSSSSDMGIVEVAARPNRRQGDLIDDLRET